MNVRQTTIIAFTPFRGTLIYLGIVACLALLQTVLVERVGFIEVISFTFGYTLMALSLKLFMGAVFGFFIGNTEETLPRGSMFLLALLFSIISLILFLPSFQS